MSNSVDPDDTAHYEPSHLDLRCLQNLLSSPMTVKELSVNHDILKHVFFF